MQRLVMTMLAALVPLLFGFTPPPDLPAKVDALFTDFAKPGAPGATVAVLVHGVPVYQKAYGLAELSPATTMALASNVYLASMSKQFTAMGIMMLHEAGKLSYDDTLDKIFPEFNAYGKGITVRQLLHHTSGLKNYFDLLANPAATVTSQDVLAVLAKQTGTDFTPGSQYVYSNSGYVVLGQVIERVSGQSYGEFLKEHIFTPLGMTQTVVFDHMDTVVPVRSFGYDEESDGSFQLDDAAGDPFYAIYGDGGLYSSVLDLAKWDVGLATNRLVSAATLAEAVTPGTLNDGTKIDYGFGWELDDDHGEHVMAHGGAYNGFRTGIRRYPTSGVTVVVLTNRASADASGLAQSVADAYFSLSPAPAAGANALPAMAAPAP